MAKLMDRCEIMCYDPDKVEQVRTNLTRQHTQTAVKMFKALADDTRLKIAFSLSTEGELCVCDVAHILGSSVATASHHLRLLRSLGMVKSRKEGKMVFYSLDDDHVKELVMNAMAHSKEVDQHE